MAFGSSSALLAILSHLDAEVTVLVNPFTAEIVEPESKATKLIFADLKNPVDIKAKIVPGEFDAVLVISNKANLGVYHDTSLPVFFVDILFWYDTPKDHPIWDAAVQCFVENFPGVKERLERDYHYQKKPIIVGPIIKDIAKPVGRDSSIILVNLGGVESRWIIPGKNSRYPSLVVDILRKIATKLPGQECVIGLGKKAKSSLQKVELPQNTTIDTFPQIIFHDLLSRCDLFITSPGLNAVMEAMSVDKPIVFLPPQNASQVLQLAKYESYAIVPTGMNLDSLVEKFAIPERGVDEKQLTDDVLEALERIENDEGIKNRIVAHMKKQLDYIHDGSQARAIARYKTVYWPPGARIIAENITNWWNHHDR